MEGCCQCPSGFLSESVYTALKYIRLKNIKTINVEPCLILAVNGIYSQLH